MGGWDRERQITKQEIAVNLNLLFLLKNIKMED